MSIGIGIGHRQRRRIGHRRVTKAEVVVFVVLGEIVGRELRHYLQQQQRMSNSCLKKRGFKISIHSENVEVAWSLLYKHLNMRKQVGQNREAQMKCVESLESRGQRFQYEYKSPKTDTLGVCVREVKLII